MFTQDRPAIPARATVEDLYAMPEDGKAELVNGEMVLMPATGARPGRAALIIVMSLIAHEAERGGGFAFGDSVGFLVNLPERESFSPDAAWYVGPADVTEAMEFLPNAPALAVEVRSKNDYGPAAERAIADKIRDYFAAGTQVVWDVDTLGTDVIKVYRAPLADAPQVVYRRGNIAEAEPAVPRWRMPVDALFRLPTLGH
ncbi:MAG: Uma2 family endonuclease [Armatimonadota bacterium]|nr:Uma2 family endonuclease [Armatimonadota bacterium]